MKTKVLLSILALGIIVSAFGQKPTMYLIFKAEYIGQYVPLDSIFIENLTRGVDTTLYAPDTILSLEYNTGIEDINLSKNIFSLSQNYPNPFKEKTTVNLYLQEKEHIKITIRDIIGRKVAQYENTLNQGNHSFKFYSGNEKFYLLTVTGKYASKTIKMLNANDNITYKGKCKIVYNKNVDNVIGFKSQNAINSFVFYFRDELRYTGYAKTINEVNGSDVIEDAPMHTKAYKFEIAEGISCPGIPYITYEGQIYNTALIGDQCWLKENLNVGIRIDGSQNMSNFGVDIIEKYCFDDNEANCDEYGALYQWGEVMKYSSQEGAQGICPDGWHIPTESEWQQLEMQVGMPLCIIEWPGWRGNNNEGNKLKSVSGWINNTGPSNPINSSGFTGTPGGARLLDGSFGFFFDPGNYGNWWSSSEYPGSNSEAMYRGLASFTDEVYRGHADKPFGLSVRCLKD
ncbi:MAG: T9SS type A sorting domain-containing protein [Bacteroidales bacterium]|nr:T9SS type A sorting domain-containing protein [Bacteroidales bacterium]